MPSSGQVKSIFFLILFLLSILGGILLASLLKEPAIAQSPSSDTVLNRYQIGQQTYLENCATCHIAIPPSILPSQTWKKILENPDSHYGIRLLVPSHSFLMPEWIICYNCMIFTQSFFCGFIKFV